MVSLLIVGTVDAVGADSFLVFVSDEREGAQQSFKVQAKTVAPSVRRMIRVGALVTVTGYLSQGGDIVAIHARVCR